VSSENAKNYSAPEGKIDADAFSDHPKVGPEDPPGNVIHFKAAKTGGASAEADWREQWEKRKGVPLNNLANVMIALRDDGNLKDKFAFDEMSLEIIVQKPLPGSSDAESKFRARPITDIDVTNVQEYLQTTGLAQVGTPVVHQAIDARGHERAFHPVRDQLSSLEWDGKPRTLGWLSTYLGAPKNDYTLGVGKMFLLSMVARVYLPGCKCDYTIILEAPQGSEKSTACRILGGRWFSDSLPEVSGKDAAQHLAGKWLIELSEMAVMSKWESSSLKAFLTRQEDRYRPPYGRKEIIQKRQCTFIGTTNQSVYLKDSTGGRRFWPVIVGKIDNDSLAKDRDQLFAEAVTLFNAGEKWYPDAHFEQAHIRREQEARFEIDSWEDEVREFLDGKDEVRVGQILWGLGFVEVGHRSTKSERRVTDILQRLNWRRDLKKDSKGNTRWIRIISP
jgi:predicted P-loop ATPase